MHSIRNHQGVWLRGATAAVSLLAIAACAQYGSTGLGTDSGLGTATSPALVEQTLYAAGKSNNFRLSLTDAPHFSLQKVVVNVDHADLFLEGGGKEARVQVAERLGAIDLLTIQNGLTLPMADLNIPQNVTVRQIRLVLSGDGNYIIRSDGSRCDLKTPSEQKTGIKFIITDGVLIEKGFSYSIVADFDAHKSIVLTGNGGCLLKPVLRLKSATRIEQHDDNGGNGDESPPSPSPSPAPETIPLSMAEAGPTPTPSPTPVPETPLAPSGSTQVGDSSGWDTTTTSTSPTISPVNLDIYF